MSITTTTHIDREASFEKAYEHHLDAMFADAFGDLPHEPVDCCYPEPPSFPDLEARDACLYAWATRCPNARQRRKSRRDTIPF